MKKTILIWLALAAIPAWAQPLFTLPALPYALDALEPVISEETMSLHYGKHLQGYIDKLNRLTAGSDFEKADLETIVLHSAGDVFDNAAQVWNHEFYFNTFSPTPDKEPSPELLSAIETRWGSFPAFKQAFEEAGSSLFGSGWIWLAKDGNGNLYIEKSPNAGNPMTEGLTPLLGIDVWEHAYYLDYRNRRAEHLSKIWEIIDWKTVSERYRN